MLRTCIPLFFVVLLFAFPGLLLTRPGRRHRCLAILTCVSAVGLAAAIATFLFRNFPTSYSQPPISLSLLLFAPLAAGFAMLLIRSSLLRYALLIQTGMFHAGLTFCLGLFFIHTPPHSKALTPQALHGLLYPDRLGTLFLALASLLFVAASIYAVGYLRGERRHTAPRRDFQDGTVFTNAPEQRFLACLCFFLASMTLVTMTRHLGALWVGIELTTLTSAPLIYFHRHRRSLEATWKYLMICSVGIALAFMGNILFTLAFYPEMPEYLHQMHFFTTRAAHAAGEDGGSAPWLKAGFIFLLVGYGTKMGLAPLHNWLPDAHSQAPSLVSALLSGALLNCAFLGILRGHEILLAAGLGGFSGGLLMFFGLLSMLVAAIFIVGQGHFKRLLAYSSVEHMGILALGVGAGGAAAHSALLHSVNHSLTKCMLFLLAGNILSHYHTYSSYDARGLRRAMPITAALWLAGFLAIVGSPPFGLFVSEFSLLKALFSQQHWWAAGVYLTALAVIFVGMSVPVLRMVQGPKPPSVGGHYAESLWNVGPSLALGLLVLTLGLYVPDWLTDFLRDAAVPVGGGGHGM